MVKKVIILLFLFVIFLNLSSSSVYASVLSVGKNGEIIWKVLSQEDSLDISVPSHSSIEVKKVFDDSVNPKSLIELRKDDGKISLSVFNDNESREISVNGFREDLIEVEERAEVQRFNIGVVDNKFSISQGKFLALTEYPIQVDPKSARISLKTESGERFLAMLPSDVVRGVLKSKLISRVKDNLLEIKEEKRDLQYSFSGEKVFNIFNFFEYSVPVSLKVSAITGETVSIDGPFWYKIIGFFFS